MKNVFDRQFLWVFLVDRCGEPEEIVKTAAETGMGLAVKINDGNPADDERHGFLKNYLAVKEIADKAGVPMFAWGYVYGNLYGSITAEIEMIKRALNEYGALGYIINAEKEWECKEATSWAERYAQALAPFKDRIAHCPVWNTRWHPLFPAETFAQFCSVVMPQIYFATANRYSPEKRAEMARISFEDWGKHGIPVFPVGQLSAGVEGVKDFLKLIHAPAWSWWTMDNQRESSAIEYLKNEYRHAPVILQNVIEEAHATAMSHGFWDLFDIMISRMIDEDFPKSELDAYARTHQSNAIMLMVSELSEAVEALRANEPPARVAEELADALIRMGDLCGHFNYDLAGAVRSKMAANKLRPKLHGKVF